MSPSELKVSKLVKGQKYYYLHMDDNNLPKITEVWFDDCAYIKEVIVGNWFRYVIPGGTLPYNLRYVETREVISDNFDVLYSTFEEAEIFKTEVINLLLWNQRNIIDIAAKYIGQLKSLL